MSTAARTFRVALVGCGRISKNHFDALARIDGLTLSAVCDVIPERARVAGERLGVPWFTSYEEMLERAECDVVAICTPSGLHPRHGIMAAQVPSPPSGRRSPHWHIQPIRRAGAPTTSA